MALAFKEIKKRLNIQEEEISLEDGLKAKFDTLSNYIDITNKVLVKNLCASITCQYSGISCGVKAISGIDSLGSKVKTLASYICNITKEEVYITRQEQLVRCSILGLTTDPIDKFVKLKGLFPKSSVEQIEEYLYLKMIKIAFSSLRKFNGDSPKKGAYFMASTGLLKDENHSSHLSDRVLSKLADISSDVAHNPNSGNQIKVWLFKAETLIDLDERRRENGDSFLTRGTDFQTQDQTHVFE
jgi:hypothetical protein